MGLFRKDSQIEKMLKAGGNFAWIAQNMAAIYYAVPLTPFGKTLSEEQRLFATGLIDATAYLQEGSLCLQDIQDALLWGMTGNVGLELYTVSHRDMFDFEENKNLVGLTMQLEARFFELSDAGIGYREIVDAVITAKQVISDTIEKTLAEGAQCHIFPEVMQNTAIALANPDLQQIILSYNG